MDYFMLHAFDFCALLCPAILYPALPFYLQIQIRPDDAPS